MFFDKSRFPWVAALEQGWETARDELASLGSARFGEYPGQHLYNHDWTMFPFFVPGERLDQNVAACPKTVKLLEAVPNITLAMFSKLGAGTHIGPHVGHTKAVLRFHLPLVVPEGAAVDTCGLRVGEERRPWAPGEVLVFDDMYDHEAWNHMGEDRVVLMCDFLRPFAFRTSTFGLVRQRLAFRSKHMRSGYADGVRQFVRR